MALDRGQPGGRSRRACGRRHRKRVERLCGVRRRRLGRHLGGRVRSRYRHQGMTCLPLTTSPRRQLPLLRGLPLSLHICARLVQPPRRLHASSRLHPSNLQYRRRRVPAAPRVHRPRGIPPRHRPSRRSRRCGLHPPRRLYLIYPWRALHLPRHQRTRLTSTRRPHAHTSPYCPFARGVPPPQRRPHRQSPPPKWSPRLIAHHHHHRRQQHCRSGRCRGIPRLQRMSRRRHVPRPSGRRHCPSRSRRQS